MCFTKETHQGCCLSLLVQQNAPLRRVMVDGSHDAVGHIWIFQIGNIRIRQRNIQRIGCIQQTEKEISERLDKLPDILREDGYPDVQAFMATYREAEAVVEQYNRDLAEWERQVKQKSRPPRPPEKESVRNRLRQLQEQGRQQKPRKKSFDRDSR